MSQSQNSSNDDDAVSPKSDDPASSNHDGGLSARTVLLGILFMILAMVVVAVLLQVFVADRTPELTEARLAAAQELWEQHGPRSYNMDLEIRGAQPGSVHIEVRDGQVTTMTRDGRSPPERTWDVWSVPGQFETLQRELDMAEDPQHEMDVAAETQLQLRCAFDLEYGFPRRYHRYATGDAPEVFWRVIGFHPQ